MARHRVKFDAAPLSILESLSPEDRDAILSVLRDFAEGKESGTPVPGHSEIGLGADRNWAIHLVERDGIFFVIDLANEP